MKLWSMSVSYRLGLGFHALNNEGSDGGNLMQPRRIDVGSATYDGISGEILRRHILKNFVGLCEVRDLPILSFSQALHPDRSIFAIRKKARELGTEKLSKSNPQELYAAVRRSLQDCAVIDVGGFLAAFAEKGDALQIDQQTESSIEEHVAPEAVVLQSSQKSNKRAAPENMAHSVKANQKIAPEQEIMRDMADIGGKSDGGAPYTVKRDSVFDVGWLVSEQPQDVAVTQHVAYRPGGNQRLFSQTMRSNIYGGVMRADLHRIGTDDYWYLQPNTERLAVSLEEQSSRQLALVEAMINSIASPTGAKVSAWAPHVFLTEGAIVLSSARTAPFVSPIKISLQRDEEPVALNEQYATEMLGLANGVDTWAWAFADVRQLLDVLPNIRNILHIKSGL